MASGDVIVIEDTPPSSPVKTNNQKQQPTVPSTQENMYYQHQNHEFPVAEQAMIWSRNTTNFIKQSMTSVQQNNRMPLLNNNMQNKPMHFVNMGMQSRPILPRNGFQFNGIRNIPRPPYTIFNNYEHYVNSYYQLHRFGPMGNATYLNNLYNHNFWMKVKLEELPNKGEIVSQYYIDDTQTPVKMNDENIMPEFVDINTFANKLQNQENIQSNSKLSSQQTNETSLTLSTETDDRKRNKNSVPLFLKRTRLINNNTKMKIPEENEIKSDNNNKEDSDDIIFIGEFKIDEKLPEISEAHENNINNSNESNQAESSSSDQSFQEENKDAENHNTDTKYSYKCGKRKRKDRNLMPLRRNPKRQVQIEKEFLKMIDDVIMESEKEEKQKKNPNYKQNKPAAKTAIKQCRRSPRVLANSGAVYNPPSPLTTAHIREWPAEGMHERPEYDPDSGKIYPFDRFICNITNKYNAANNEPSANVKLVYKNDFVFSENLENEKPFSELCHEMLHHVIAYVATVKTLEKDQYRFKENDSDKEQFLEKLDLTKNHERIENKIYDILKSIVNDITSKDEYEQQPDSTTPALVELLKNTILFYCLTNNVEKSDVAKYIASVKPEDIIKLSNEKFKLLPIIDD